MTVKAQPSEPVTPPPQVRTPAARPVQQLGTDITGDQPTGFLPNAQVQGKVPILATHLMVFEEERSKCSF